MYFEMTHQASVNVQSALWILLKRHSRKGLGLTDDTGDPTQDGQQDADEEVAVTASLEEDGEWWEEDCEEVEADVGLHGKTESAKD